MKIFRKLFTKNDTEIVLFWITFNLNKFNKNGPKNSCIANIHPTLSNDDELKKKIYDVIDYIRENYNMNDL